MKITAVILSRNDENNYNNNFERSVYCLNTMTLQFDEVILVDWNSPNPLYNVLAPYLTKRGNLRIVQVTPEFINDTIAKQNSNIPRVCEVLGKNVGTRRANNEFIINTNIDIIAPEKKYFENIDLDKNAFYTAPRINVPLNLVLQYNTIKNLYEVLDKNKHLYYKEQVHNNNSTLSGDFYSKVNCCGDFQLASKEVYEVIKGYEESAIFRNYADTNIQIKAHNCGFKVDVLNIPYYHINHFDRAASVKTFNNWDIYGKPDYKTTNTDNWGFKDVKFEEIVL